MSSLTCGANLPPGLPQDPPSSVPLDRTADRGARRRPRASRAGREKQYHPVSRAAAALLEHPAHLRSVHRASVDQAVSRARPLRRRARQDRAAGAGPHAKPEAVASSRGGGCSAGTCACPWPWSESSCRFEEPARPAGAARSIRAQHRRRTKGLTTERVSRPRHGARCGKTAVLSSAPPSPRRSRPSIGRGVTTTSRRGFSTVVERFCGYGMAIAFSEHEARQAWAHVLERARAELPETTIVMWFADVRARRARRRRPRRSRCPARWCENACSTTIFDLIEEAAAEAAGHPVKIDSRSTKTLRSSAGGQTGAPATDPRGRPAAAYAAVGAPPPVATTPALRARSRARRPGPAVPQLHVRRVRARARATGSRTRRRWPSPRRRRPRPTTRCSSTAAWAWARPTC